MFPSSHAISPGSSPFLLLTSSASTSTKRTAATRRRRPKWWSATPKATASRFVCWKQIEGCTPIALQGPCRPTWDPWWLDVLGDVLGFGEKWSRNSSISLNPCWFIRQIHSTIVVINQQEWGYNWYMMLNAWLVTKFGVMPLCQKMQ